MRSWMLALVFLFPSWAALACTGRSQLVEIESLMDKAQAAYGQGDTEGFRTNASEMYDKLACLEHLITPKNAVRLHALMGVWARIEKDPVKEKLSFTAARTLDRTFDLASLQVKPTDPSAIAYKKAFPTKLQLEKLPKPYAGTIRFDGTPGLARPTNVPTLVQRLDSTGKARITVYLWPGEPMIVYNTKKKKNSNKIVY